MKTKLNLLAAGLFLAATTTGYAATHYVSQSSPGPSPPYTTWATAAKIIQDAVDAAAAGDEILVANGVYAEGQRWNTRVTVTNAITLVSVNGPDVTVIDGSGTVRCVYIANSAVMIGFTLTNGVAGNGGGLLCESTSAVLSNCVLSGNSATEGGGAYGGTLNNCTFSGNAAYGHFGPGAPGALFPGPIFTFYPGLGGGAYGGTLNNCVLSGNSATGPLRGGAGGGAYHSRLNNCTLSGNSAWQGGGAASSTLNNCIVYFNSGPNGGNYDPSSTLNYCCTSPQPTNGTANIDADPLFMDYANDNLRPRAASPCINAGSNLYAASTADLEGNPRISGGVVDMGAYEFVFTRAMEVGRLMLQVNDMDLPAKHKQPLLVTLAAAMASFDRGNLTAGANQLSAFQHKVRAQVARIDAALANELIAAARQITGPVEGR